MLSPKTPNYRKRQNYSVGECGVLLDYPLHCFSMVDSVPPQLLWFPQVSALRQRVCFLLSRWQVKDPILQMSDLSKSLKISQISQNLSKSLKISQNLFKYIQKIIYIHWFHRSVRLSPYPASQKAANLMISSPAQRPPLI